MKMIISLIFIVILAGCQAPIRPTPGEPRFLFDVKNYREALAEECDLYEKEMNILAISGGGPNGAWGAGFFKGWTESKNRPKFDVVTGVSTGALLSPFAFLGQEYDELAHKSYTSVRDENIFDKRFWVTIPFSNSIALTDPLLEAISVRLTNEVIDLIGKENTKGRKLLVATCDLDSAKLFVWDLTAIAASEDPDRYERFRKIVLASASIPVLFPPVFIDGRMQVDGGTRAVAFIENVIPQGRKANIYVLINGYPGGGGLYVVPNHIYSISKRVVVTMCDAIQIGDLYRMYSIALKNDANFYLHFADNASLTGFSFDPVNMEKLYQQGYDSGKNPKWKREVPEELN